MKIYKSVAAGLALSILFGMTTVSAVSSADTPTAYRGEGTCISVISDGFLTEHKSFILTTDLKKLTREKVNELFVSSSACEILADGTDAEVYKSDKIPFAFDYGDGDTDVFDRSSSDLGTAMISLAAGNTGKGEAYHPAEAGEAPEAQVLAMKVYSSAKKTVTAKATSSAIRDSVLLGADVILITPTVTGGIIDDEYKTAVDSALKFAYDSGVCVICPAGDMEPYGASGIYSKFELEIPTSMPDIGTVAYPASSEYVTSVGSAVTNMLESPAIMPYSKTPIPYSDANYLFKDATNEKTFGEFFDGKTLEYVVIDGIGKPEEFHTVDLKNKIAVVARGEISFADKAKNAHAAGAVGVVVIDSQPNVAVTLQTRTDLTGAPIPLILISASGGKALKASEVKSFSVSTSLTCLTEINSTPTVSGTSARGTSPELSLKPDLCVIGASAECIAADGSYTVLNSTNAAAARAAGIYASVYQKLSNKLVGASAHALRSTALSAMSSSAQIMTRTDGTPYSPRAQGAGCTSLEAALNAAVILSCDGLHKIELGDNNGRILQFKVTARNISETVKSCTLDAEAGSNGFSVYSVEELDKESSNTDNSFSNVFGYSATDNVSFISDYKQFENTRIILGTTLYQLNAGRSDYTPFTFSLAPGESMTFDISIYVDEATYQIYEKYFTNGFFVEGFVRVSFDGGVSSIPLIGYCGSFSKSPAADYDIMSDKFTVYGGLYLYRYARLSGNADIKYSLGIHYRESIDEDEKWNRDLLALSPAVDGDSSMIFLNFPLLRTVTDVKVTVTDSDENVIFTKDFGTVLKTSVPTSGKSQLTSLPLWDGRAADVKGYVFPSGMYSLTVSFRQPMSNKTESISYDIYLDTESPKYVSHSYRLADGVPTLTVEASDNHGIRQISVLDTKLNYAEKNSDGTFDLTGFIGKYIYIDIYDHALNSTVVKVKNPAYQDLPEDQASEQ